MNGRSASRCTSSYCTEASSLRRKGRLGNLLFMRYGMAFGIKPEARAPLGQEALKWVGLAASQGDKQGEANLASICLEGKLVKQDLIAAYKWGNWLRKVHPSIP